MRLITPKELSAKLNVPKAAIAALERRDDSFPKAIRITKRTLRWDEEEIDKWLDDKRSVQNESD